MKIDINEIREEISMNVNYYLVLVVYSVFIFMDMIKWEGLFYILEQRNMIQVRPLKRE
jgi:hypothetical protein